MTGVVRDIFRAHPGRFRIGISSPSPLKQIWDNNPLIERWSDLGKKPDGMKRARIVGVNFGFHGANERGMHFIEVLARAVGESLGIDIPMTEPNGDLYLSKSERERNVSEIVGTEKPYIIIAASVKTDTRTKWWPREYWQKVIYALRDRIDFIQVGHHATMNMDQVGNLSNRSGTHFPWPLDGVINQVGKTSARELMLACRGAAAVIGQISFIQHVTAAMRRPNGGSIPHITLAGGRESQFMTQGNGNHALHTIGAMDCCKSGGCYKSHLDGTEIFPRDTGQCHHPEVFGSNRFAGCMLRITPELVIETIRSILTTNA
jgi:ADP-heptose:LPS heptosyltransferase